MTAEQWNALYPVGTAVMAYPGVRPEHPLAVMVRERRAAGRHVDARDAELCQALETKTRSVAWPLGHAKPVVLVDGQSGGIHLTHIDVIDKDGAA
ncbi:hypothetical protein [Streptomyces sp. NPDC020141]|uniref:hypothetical protein n=1 Tax=Streptomyces sp. NPDC020141 TaxID=3365065 RepID=UPI0037ACCAFC